jgi:hypothetical protein
MMALPASAAMMPKRQRSGSISGRLRAASDLADHGTLYLPSSDQDYLRTMNSTSITDDSNTSLELSEPLFMCTHIFTFSFTGLINEQEKGIVKDLIISGDSAVTDALDTYQGSLSGAGHNVLKELGNTIKQTVQVRSMRGLSIDIAEGMDFDFMKVEFDEDYAGVVSEAAQTQRQRRDSMEDLIGVAIDVEMVNNSGTDKRKRLNSFDMGGDFMGLGAWENGAIGTLPFGPGGGDPMSEAAAINHSPFDDFNPTGLTLKGVSSSKAKESTSKGPTSTNANYNKSVSSSSSSDNNSSSSSNLSGSGATGTGMSGSLHSSGIPAAALAALQRPPNTTGVAVVGGNGYIGAYSPTARKERIARFLQKRNRRVWTKKVKYDVRKNFADSRIRVKGRFVKKEDEEILRELLTI